MMSEKQTPSLLPLALVLTGVMFVGVVLAPLSMVIVPVAKRLAAPVACPSGYLRSIVVEDINHPEPGVTSFSSELYCIKASGRPVRARDLRVFLGLWGAEATGMVVLFLTAFGLDKLSQLRRRAK